MYVNYSKFNLFLGLLHLSSGIFILANKEKANPFFSKVSVYRTFIPKSPNLDSSSITSNQQELFKVDILVCISIFFFITAFFHFYYAWRGSSVFKTDNSNQLRWMEYSITATLMTIIMALSATVLDFYTLLLLAVCTFAIMMLGGVIESALTRLDMKTVKVCTMIAWFLQIFVFFVIGDTFIRRIKSVNEQLKKENATKVIPSWVYILLIVELIFFSSFGIIQLYQIKNPYKNLGFFLPEKGVSQTEFIRTNMSNYITFYNYEIMYHILSLVAKLSLGWIFYFGTVMPSKS